MHMQCQLCAVWNANMTAALKQFYRMKAHSAWNHTSKCEVTHVENHSRKCFYLSLVCHVTRSAWTFHQYLVSEVAVYLWHCFLQDSRELSSAKASLQAAPNDAAASKEMIQALCLKLTLATDRLVTLERQPTPIFKEGSGKPLSEEQQQGANSEQKTLDHAAQGNVRRKVSQVRKPRPPQVPCHVCLQQGGTVMTVASLSLQSH